MTVGDFSLVTISLLFLMLTSANILGSVLGLQNIYYSFGKQNIFSKIMLSALIINVIGSVFLGHYIGMLGIGLSTAMATVYVAIQIRRFIGVINA
jgi:O-antigen/teichoic acid export membrane protein